jgi:hypothetical protein
MKDVVILMTAIFLGHLVLVWILADPNAPPVQRVQDMIRVECVTEPIDYLACDDHWGVD